MATLRLWQKVTLAVIAASILSLVTLTASFAWCGGWCYNARIDVEGTEIAALWMVNGGNDLDEQFDYKANIEVNVPKGASTSVVDQASTETVGIKHVGNLKCSTATVQVSASVRIKSVSIGTDLGATVLFELWDWTNMVMLDAVTGRLDQALKLTGQIPVVNPSCAVNG